MIIAKKSKSGYTQSLKDHTSAVVKWSEKLKNPNIIDNIALESEILRDEIEELIDYCTYFHDIGKATIEFQNTINKGSKSTHALYSSAFCTKTQPYYWPCKEEGLSLSLLIILTHHSMFSEALFGDLEKSKKYEYHYLEETKKCFEKNSIAIDPKNTEMICTKAELEEDIFALKSDIDCLNLQQRQKLHMIYSYVHGLLKMSDWLASAEFEEKAEKKQSMIKFLSHEKMQSESELLKTFAKTIKIDSFEPREFQKKLMHQVGSCLVEIPTGEGKTEGAILWARENTLDRNMKINFTLPTQTTSNKLFERLETIYPRRTGLVHGASKVYLEDQLNKETHDWYFNSVFAYPVNVATLDSLYKNFFNIGNFTMALHNILNSVVIIDEIHAYDFKFLGFTKWFLKWAEKNDIPVCIMSASIPNVLKQMLEIDKWDRITDEKLFSKKSNYIQKHHESLDESLDDIISDLESGKNVLVIKNTVKEATAIYQELKELLDESVNKLLYHSKFKKKDRIKKENQIFKDLKDEKPALLVASQVVEMSLDIDFDRMYTDNAPIDALIQRFGRVNRKKKTPYGIVHIYEKTAIKPYEEIMLNHTFERIEEGLSTLGDYNIWLNDIYDRVFEDEMIKDKVKSDFYSGFSLYELEIKNHYGVYKQSNMPCIRDIERPQVDVILEDDYDRYDREGLEMRYEDTVSVNAYLRNLKSQYLIQAKNYKFHQPYDVLNLDYSEEIGVIMPTNTIEDDMI